MAGETHAINIGDDDLLPPWSTVFDVIEATDINDWVLVGGLMVQLHARRASIPPPRATKDVDLVVDIAANHAGVTNIASALTRIGFEPIVPDSRKEPIYRFQRDREQVVMMVADHLPSQLKPRPRQRIEGHEQGISAPVATEWQQPRHTRGHRAHPWSL